MGLQQMVIYYLTIECGNGSMKIKPIKLILKINSSSVKVEYLSDIESLDQKLNKVIKNENIFKWQHAPAYSTIGWECSKLKNLLIRKLKLFKAD